MREAQRRCDSREFSEWKLLDQIEPWSERRADMRTAHQTMHLMSALSRGTHRLSQYVLEFVTRPRQTLAEAKALIKAAFAR